MLAAGAGVGYDLGGIGVPLVYAALLLAGLITLFGYVCWDDQHHT